MDYNELPNILPRDVRGEYFVKGTEKLKNLDSLLDKEDENLDIRYCPKVQVIVDKEVWIVRVTHSDTGPQIAEQSEGKVVW